MIGYGDEISIIVQQGQFFNDAVTCDDDIDGLSNGNPFLAEASIYMDALHGNIVSADMVKGEWA